MPRLRDLAWGPPPALPDVLDRAAERWATTPPRLRWAATGALLVVALAAIGRGAVVSPWGPRVEVLVVAADVPPGRALTAADVRVATWPRDLAVEVATRPAQVLGAVSTRRLMAGEPVRLDVIHDGGLAAFLGTDRAAVPVRDEAAPPVTVGWLVDVVGQGYDGEAHVLARDARVLAIDGEVVWLEVARADAPAVVAASARGDASLVLLPPD
ncbi:MAG TPA: SAF domain-containing protein [Nitriliruptorales bacterium]